MKFDLHLMSSDLHRIAAQASAAEAAGFDGLWTAETGNDPFLPLVLAAEHTQRIMLGTAIAVAFARSPMTVAYTAWDLARLSQGRFILGLGSQVKGHIERRYSMPWLPPAARMREYIEALRAIFKSWREGGSALSYQGRFYRFSLMTPFFTPPAHQWSDIPIYIAGLNPRITALAGELCQGFIVHTFHTPRYLREVVIPNLESGLARAGRRRGDIELVSGLFGITGDSEQERAAEREAVRRQIAFYGSTRTYKPVLDLHGWGEVALRLNQRAARGDWAGMAAEISDEMVDTFALSAPLDELGPALASRYGGLLDRVSFYHWAPEPTARWARAVTAVKKAAG